MPSLRTIPARAFLIALGLSTLALAAAGAVSFRTDRSGDQFCITSNGLPDHTTGQFPNRGNPHSIKPQRVNVCLPAAPVKGSTPREVRVTGIAINGVQIRPGTADYYDASSPRGHSRNAASGWNLDGMGARTALGLDAQNAHVGPRGEYHYHGMPPALIDTNGSTLMGWAADGFEIHYVGDAARPGYLLLPGPRASAPGGAHDGTYNEDWTYVPGAGNLDECNGAVSNGRYVYFATDGYPFFPRCLWGTEITRIR